MSGGPEDASRTDRLAGDVERAAAKLAEALLETQDRMFHRVHPQAIEYANEILSRETGYVLMKAR